MVSFFGALLNLFLSFGFHWPYEQGTTIGPVGCQGTTIGPISSQGTTIGPVG